MTVFPRFQKCLESHLPPSPVPWLRGPHLQTLVSYYFPTPLPHVPEVFEVVDLEDGDKLSIVLTIPERHWVSQKRTVLLVHGLSGSYLSPYMVRMTYWLYERDIQVVRVNLRGCGSGAPLARYPGHAGRSEDIRQVLHYLQNQYGLEKATLLGFSMGGNIVLKLAGEWGEEPPQWVDSIGAVCPPIDLHACCARVESSPVNKLYEQSFVQHLKQMVFEKRRYFPDFKAPEFPAAPSLREFDAIYTAPASGFSSVDEYYSQAQAARVMDSIRIPTFILAAEDDPLIDPEPIRRFEGHPYIWPLILPHGGHLGFWLEAPPPFGHRWMDWVLVLWILSLDQREGELDECLSTPMDGQDLGQSPTSLSSFLFSHPLDQTEWFWPAHLGQPDLYAPSFPR